MGVSICYARMFFSQLRVDFDNNRFNFQMKTWGTGLLWDDFEEDLRFGMKLEGQ